MLVRWIDKKKNRVVSYMDWPPVCAMSLLMDELKEAPCSPVGSTSSSFARLAAFA